MSNALATHKFELKVRLASLVDQSKQNVSLSVPKMMEILQHAISFALRFVIAFFGLKLELRPDHVLV